MHGVVGVLIPGGSAIAGFGTSERAELLASLGSGPGSSVWREAYERCFALAPPRDAEWAPFVIASTPVLDCQPVVPEPIRGRCPIEGETDELWASLEDPDSSEESWEDEDAAFEAALERAHQHRPAFTTREEAPTLASALDARLPTDDEWEVAARLGGSAGFASDPPHRSVDALHARPWFVEEDAEATLQRDATSTLGLWGLAFPEWTSSPQGMRCASGSVMQYPWQDRAERIGAHAAFRSDAYRLATVRCVWPLA